ncbi:hypothetical protein R5O30_15095 (plasmid) [Listeria monocytogenes]|nr:hypothetical protein R5O30_15095 [Listeria monocytogenes]
MLPRLLGDPLQLEQIAWSHKNEYLDSPVQVRILYTFPDFQKVMLEVAHPLKQAYYFVNASYRWLDHYM